MHISPTWLKWGGGKHACVLSCFSYVWLFVTPWTVDHQTPLSMGFSRHEYWSGLPCSPPGYQLNWGIEPASLKSPALAGGFFTTSATWEAWEAPGKPGKHLGSLGNTWGEEWEECHTFKWEECHTLKMYDKIHYKKKIILPTFKSLYVYYCKLKSTRGLLWWYSI